MTPFKDNPLSTYDDVLSYLGKPEDAEDESDAFPTAKGGNALSTYDDVLAYLKKPIDTDDKSDISHGVSRVSQLQKNAFDQLDYLEKRKGKDTRLGGNDGPTVSELREALRSPHFTRSGIDTINEVSKGIEELWNAEQKSRGTWRVMGDAVLRGKEGMAHDMAKGWYGMKKSTPENVEMIKALGESQQQYTTTTRPRKSGSVTEIGGVGDALTWGAENIAEATPHIASIIALNFIPYAGQALSVGMVAEGMYGNSVGAQVSETGDYHRGLAAGEAGAKAAITYVGGAAFRNLKLMAQGEKLIKSVTSEGGLRAARRAFIDSWGKYAKHVGKAMSVMPFKTTRFIISYSRM